MMLVVKMEVKSTLNIILVDDNENDLDVATEALEEFENVKVSNFLDSEKAYFSLKEEISSKNHNEFNLIILDLNMPKTNGFSLLQKIKLDPDLSKIPVLIYTSSTRKEDRERAYSLGAASYLIKPIQVEQVEATFREVVNYWTRVSLI